MHTAARHANCWFARLVAGASLLGTGSVLAGTWTGTASTDWNNSVGNWASSNGGTVQVNTTPTNIATITANFTTIPTTILVGRGATASGRVNHITGTATMIAGTSGDLVLGQLGGNGTYNLANTSATGGALTGFGQGSGNMTIPDQVHVGGSITGTISTGTINIHTTGTLSVGTQLLVGNFGGTGTVKMDSGTITVADAIEIGNGASTIVSTLSMSGGTITKTNVASAVTIGGGVTTDGGKGTANLNGGTFTAAGVFRVGNDTIATSATTSNGTLNLGGTNLTVNGEFWIGNNTGATGTMAFSSGTLTTNNWAIVGHKEAANTGVGATGSVTMSGGTWTKTGESNFVIGDTGAGSMNMTGGLVVVTPHATADRGITWIANRNTCTGSLTISGSAEFRSSRFTLAVEPGTNGSLNLDGGTVKTQRISGGSGTDAVTFNGTQLVATGSSAGFIDNLDTATLGEGGLLVDTAGFSLIAPQALHGTGGVVKTGAGTLTLSGASDYSGEHTVSAGKLVLGSDFTGTGNVTVADGAALGVIQNAEYVSLSLVNVTLGTSAATSLDVDLGNTFGNPIAPPLNVTGSLSLGGTVTVNIADLQPAVGSFPLITYIAPLAGSGSFVLGTLPNGVVANLSDDGNGTVTLEITSISFPEWSGAVDGIWDTSTQNWIDQLSTLATVYADPLPVVFNDYATQNTAITLDIPVAPASVTIDNSNAVYSFSGAGKITGSTGLTKAGTAVLTLDTANDYTGPTILSGGMTSVNSLANGGSASSIGAASSDLVLSGGSLTYTGANATTDRGLAINAAGTTISTANNVTFGGQITSTNGNLSKTGGGNLTFSYNGANALGSVANGVLVQAGTLTLSGAGAQSNSITGEMRVADQPDISANLVLSNTSLTTTSWLTIGRGNGDSGVTNLTATNSTITSVNFSTGYNNGLANNASEAFVTLNNTVWTNNGVTNLAESTGSTATMTITGTSQYNVSNNFLLGNSGGTNATVTLSGSGKVNKSGGYTAIGQNGIAVLNVTDNAQFNATTQDFNISDVGSSTGTLNLSGSGLVNVANVYIGKGGGTQGTLAQSGGTFQSSNFISIGRFFASNGFVNISAGALTAGTVVNIGAEGNGTLSVSGTGNVTANGDGVFVGSMAGGLGTLNLNGGTVTTKRVAENLGGLSSVNFNGGLLKAAAGANATFIGPIDTATILSGGAFIDTSGQTLSVTANLAGSGGLTKSGAGTLTLADAYSYTGNTTVSTGTLSLAAASLANSSTVNLAAGAVLNLPHGATDIVASLVIAGTPLATGVYDATTHPGVITGTGKIQVSGAVVSAYATWIGGYPSILLADRDPGDDPDHDGSSNVVEFALGGTPDNGSDNPKVYSIVADSSADGDSTQELLMTIAVRLSTPAFTGSPSPAATQDGVTYKVQGSSALSGFTGSATPVNLVTPPAPNAAPPAGYEYRTFSLGGSNGTPDKGFLRVGIENP